MFVVIRVCNNPSIMSDEDPFDVEVLGIWLDEQKAIDWLVEYTDSSDDLISHYYVEQVAE